MWVGKRSRSKGTEKEGGEDHQHNACNSPRASKTEQKPMFSQPGFIKAGNR